MGKTSGLSNWPKKAETSWLYPPPLIPWGQLEYSSPLSNLHSRCLTVIPSTVFPVHLRRATSSRDANERESVSGLHTLLFLCTGKGKGRKEKRLGFCDSKLREQALQPSLEHPPQPSVALSGSPGHPTGSSEALRPVVPHDGLLYGNWHQALGP